MHTISHQELHEPVSTWKLWYAVLIGAAAWKLQLVVFYVLVPYACWHGLPILIHISSLTALLLALSGGWTGLESWRSAGRTMETEIEGVHARSRFMGLSGMIMGPFFGLLIIGQWIPILVLSPCDGIA